MSKKSEVLRVSEAESKLVKLLRGLDREVLFRELDLVALEMGDKAPFLSSIKCSLTESKPVTLEDLVYSNVITNDVKDLIISRINTNKHISITGRINSGKTTILRAILNYISEKGESFKLFEHKERSEFTGQYKCVKSIDKEGLWVKSLVNNLLLDFESKVILSEVLTVDDVLALILSMQSRQTIFTTPSNKDITRRLLSLSPELPNKFKELLDSDSVLKLHCSNNGENYTVEVMNVYELV